MSQLLVILVVLRRQHLHTFECMIYCLYNKSLYNKRLPKDPASLSSAAAVVSEPDIYERLNAYSELSTYS